ncbi:EI24 domain-containing protein [Nitrospirillum sp. BR 11163]|uniref:EI24 domain-containing protein n=1 Tax=Nitrospirillum sp. BR 11163 TaxID=3104323 RepID=UPI002AFE6EE0|nr:EI24 domain-containing protein [Nitrospirillum sp. BR 11163]MEA1677533.1 EI24 domain-containing protein [Nitrospirillum sp. BR 11163]
MIRALFRTLAQAFDPALLRVMARSFILTLLSFIALGVAVSWGLDRLHPTGKAWLDPLITVAGALGVVALAWYFFLVVVAAIAGMLLEPVARAVERRWYPTLPPPREAGVVEETAIALRFLVLLVIVNVAVLPLWLLPPVGAVAYPLANGFLLGRQYFDQVAVRRMPPDQARLLRLRYRGRIFCAGLIIAFISLLPVVNLFAPVLATAFMLHLFGGFLPTGGTRSPLPVAPRANS